MRKPFFIFAFVVCSAFAGASVFTTPRPHRAVTTERIVMTLTPTTMLRLEVSLCDENAARIICVNEPHKVRGFADQVRMIEAGWKRLKLIDTPKIINNASAGVIVSEQNSMTEMYKPKWLREKEAAFLAEAKAQAEAQYGLKQLCAPGQWGKFRPWLGIVEPGIGESAWKTQ
jgi:hypothetical protein